jgi:uncharacterized GH25 family protein
MSKRQIFYLLVAFTFLFPLTIAETNAQIRSTGVRITVFDRLGSLVENAKVTIYETREDYENEENAVAGPSFTDSKGRVTFKNLDVKVYFVQVIKGEENNYGDAEQTGELQKGKLNKFNKLCSKIYIVY